MSLIKEYTDYLKDNPEGYWFKRKLYGWGWTPARWQGWMVIAVFTALIVLNFYWVDANTHSVSDTLFAVLPRTVLLVLLLILVCYKKGESPRWMWGDATKK